MKLLRELNLHLVGHIAKKCPSIIAKLDYQHLLLCRAPWELAISRRIKERPMNMQPLGLAFRVPGIVSLCCREKGKHGARRL